MSKDIIVCGDIHGYWKYLNALIARRRPSVILQAGDFGWFPGKVVKPYTRNGMRFPGFDPYGVKAGETDIYFTPGNHENWDELDKRKAEFSQLMPNVWYARRGAHFTLPDGRIVMFMGGAASIDKWHRTPGVSWFPQEMIPLSELYKLEKDGPEKVDIMITHTCPQEFNPILNKKKPYDNWIYKFYDSSQEVLSELLYMYKPSLWYFGHFHIATKGYHKETDTQWYCLNDVPNPKWWRYLDG